MVCFLLIPGRQNTFLICTISWRHETDTRNEVWAAYDRASHVYGASWCPPELFANFSVESLSWVVVDWICWVGCRYFTWDEKTTPQRQRRRSSEWSRRVVFCFFPLVVETLKHGSVGFSVTLWAVLSSHFDDFWVCSTNLPLNTFANSSQKGKLEYF